MRFIRITSWFREHSKLDRYTIFKRETFKIWIDNCCSNEESNCDKMLSQFCFLNGSVDGFWQKGNKYTCTCCFIQAIPRNLTKWTCNKTQAFTTTTGFFFYCTGENKSVFNIYSNYLQEMRESNIKRVAFFKYIYSVIELCHKFYLWC